jgi:hypothetical protein
MYYLARLFPFIDRVHIPVSRDQLMLLMAAINEIFLGIDIYLAHSISGTIVPNEWIPIIFGPIAGILLLLAGLVALRNRPLATVFASIVFAGSIVIGILGAYFHLVRAILPGAPPGEQVTVNLLVWAPPILAPLTFSLVGLFGISAAWKEDPPDSGIIDLLGGLRLHLPYSKTRAYIFMFGMGSLATVISSVLDHARTNFENPWLWLPTAVGVFATVVAAALGAAEHPNRGDLVTYVAAMVLMILVGVLGSILHISENLTAEGTIVGERFLAGAPFLAPMLFANMGALGLMALLDPKEKGFESIKAASRE